MVDIYKERFYYINKNVDIYLTSVGEEKPILIPNNKLPIPIKKITKTYKYIILYQYRETYIYTSHKDRKNCVRPAHILSMIGVKALEDP